MGKEASTSAAAQKHTGPRLQLVPNEPSDGKVKVAWPFAPDSMPTGEESPESPSDGPAGRKDGAKKHPPKPPLNSQPKLRALPSKAKRPRSSSGIIIPGIPLPPATEFDNSQPIRLKRNESVLGEAAKERKGFWRVGALAKRAGTDVANAFSNFGFAAASVIGERSVNAVRQFEALPRKKQIMWVAAPYAVVLVLVLVLVELKEPARASANVITPATIAAMQSQPPIQVLSAPQPAQQPAQQTAPKPVDRPAAKTNDAPAPEPEKPATTTQMEKSDLPLVAPGERSPRTLRGLWRTVPIASSLRIKPDQNALKVGRLKAGGRVIVYPDFPTRDGFILAQRPGGEIGFLVASHLDGKKDPRFDRMATQDGTKKTKKSKHPRSQRGQRF